MYERKGIKKQTVTKERRRSKERMKGIKNGKYSKKKKGYERKFTITENEKRERHDLREYTQVKEEN